MGLNETMTTRVVLIGLSGAGKSTVGARLAARLGWTLVDTDAEIERLEGRSIPQIFAESGEEAFRNREREVFRSALDASNVVIATGGGAVANDEAWTDAWLGHDETVTIWLDAPADVLFARLVDQQRQDPEGAERPLLAGNDPLARFRAMQEARTPYYRRASMTIPVAKLDTNAVTGLIARALIQDDPDEVVLDVPGGVSRIRIGNGVRGQLGETVATRWPGAKRVWVMSDENVARHHLAPTLKMLADGGITAESVTFPPGESSKSLACVRELYDALLGAGIERTDVIVALGGGVTGDLVGFAAASVLRGVGLVQMPTSLLAMVDSSVGGKTGINHATGKNLIGAFYQPSEVLVDPDYLMTLPEREYRAGWAEVIKHGLIEPSTPAGASGLFELVSANAMRLLDRSSPLLAAIVARNVRLKASVVQADEREAGLRAILNLGHTIGHAVEASGYELLHGEAVAVGLHGVMQLAYELGRIHRSQVDEVAELLVRFGLPVTVSAAPDDIRRYMSHDKKRVSGQQQWVIPTRDGGVAIERDIPVKAVENAIHEVTTVSARN